VKKLIKDMNTAYESDKKANEEKRAGFSRFKLLGGIMQFCKNGNYQEDLVSNDFCEIAAKWLNPLPDGSLPNPRIRFVILEALWELPIEFEHLEATHLGRIVRSMSHYPRETRENKGRNFFASVIKVVELATRLWQKWSRKVNHLPASYKSGLVPDHREEEEEEEEEEEFIILF
jgi:hypothetical protein